MKTEVEKLEGNRVKLKVEVPSQVLDGALKRTYKDLSQRLFVPGFRKGKIPQKVIDAQVGRDTVVARAAEDVINTRYPEALVRSGIEPIEQPEVNVVRAEAGQDLVFEADVEVKPEAKLGEYKNLEVVVPSPEATETDIDQQIDILRQRYARLEVVEDRPLEEGDYALIDYSGQIEGAEFEGGSAEDYMVEIGSGMLLKGLEEGLIGMKKGESRTIELDMPEDFHNKDLAGKKGTFEVTLKEIKQKVLPDVDDEFVSESTEHDTVAELREDLGKKMELVKRAQSRVQAESVILDELTKNAEVEVSDKLVDFEVDNMLDEMSRNLRRQGTTLDEYLKMTGSTLDKVREEFREDAEKRIKRELAIIAVAKAENITVSQEELDGEIAAIAQALNKPLPEVRQTIDQRGTLPELNASLLRRKTIDWLMENAEAKTDEGKPVDLSPPAPPVADVADETEQVEALADQAAEEATVRETPEGVEEGTDTASETAERRDEEVQPAAGEGQTNE